MRAIFELEMPERCWDCPILHIDETQMVNCPATASIFSESFALREMRKDCPLILSEEYFKIKLDWATKQLINKLETK